MKKYFLYFSFFLLLLPIGAQTKIDDLEKALKILNAFDLENEEVNFWFQGTTKAQIASCIIDSSGFIYFLYNGSGFYINLNDLVVGKDFFTISFIKIWVGAEETVKGDARKLFKYIVTVHKEDIPDKTDWLVRIPYVSPIAILADAFDSVKNYKNFHVKFQTEVKDANNDTGKTVFEISPETMFDILDVVLDENNKEKLWFKIKYNEIEGYIPLEALSEEWTVVENNLPLGEKELAEAKVSEDFLPLKSDPQSIEGLQIEPIKEGASKAEIKGTWLKFALIAGGVILILAFLLVLLMKKRSKG